MKKPPADLTLEERRRLLVEEINELTALLEKEGLMTLGSERQPRAHPAIAARHAALAELRQLERLVQRQAEAEERRLANVPLYLRSASPSR